MSRAVLMHNNIISDDEHLTAKAKKGKSSMARNPPVENLLPQNVGSIINANLQACNILLIFSEYGIFGVLINLWFVMYFLGSACIPQCSECLIIVEAGRTNVGHHDGLGVPTQGVLK